MPNRFGALWAAAAFFSAVPSRADVIAPPCAREKSTIEDRTRKNLDVEHWQKALEACLRLSKEGTDEEKDRIAKADAVAMRDVRRDQHLADKEWMRLALSAQLCHIPSVLGEAQRAYRQALRSLPPESDELNDARSTFYDLGQKQSFAREALRRLRVRALPCSGEVAAVAKCITRADAPECQRERIGDAVFMIEHPRFALAEDW